MTNTINSSSIRKSDYKRYLEAGINYERYSLQLTEDLLSNKDATIEKYINLNKYRMQRVEKTYTVSPQLAEQVTGLKHKTYWLILTEHWCGDASRALPVFNKIAELSKGKIVMKLVYRDQNPELMEAHLTDRTRSIPKLIQLDEQFNVTGILGAKANRSTKISEAAKIGSCHCSQLRKSIAFVVRKRQTTIT